MIKKLIKNEKKKRGIALSGNLKRRKIFQKKK